MILGTGTVYDASTTVLLVDAGANFVVTAIVSREVARFCDRGVLLTNQGPEVPR